MAGTEGSARARMPSCLVWVSDETPGITRRGAGRGYSYRYPNGERVKDLDERARINALAIPPAWRDVWICPDPYGHIQASGRDAKGRKQYRYHDEWRLARDATKFEQLEKFAKALPRIRRRMRRDLAGPRHDHAKLVATAVRLLELTLVRIGTEQYAQRNKSYGITTLRRRHTTVRGATIRLQFRGKSGVPHDVTLRDRRLAAILRRCLDIPGQPLLKYRTPQGEVRRITSDDVNEYLKESGRAKFTARHYRTWAASVLAMASLQRAAQRQAVSKAQLNRVIAQTAQRLRNTPAICRKCYIHPLVQQAYLDGVLPRIKSFSKPVGLYADERRFLAFLVSIRRKKRREC